MSISTGWTVCVAAFAPASLLLANPSGLKSDDFNTCDLDRSIWTVIDPIGASTVETADMGTEQARLVISLPAGASHDLWSSHNQTVRIMQPAKDADFELQVKFDSLLTGGYQMQGLLIEQDDGRFVRYDLINDGANTFLFAATFSRGSAVVRATKPLTNVAPLWLSVKRTASQWVLRYSLNGKDWVKLAEFQFAMSVARAGLFAGNWSQADAPAVLVEVDHFLNTAAPLVRQDGPVDNPHPALATSVVGEGSIAVEPLRTTYSCGEQVTVTAVPADYWRFSSWSGDLSGTQPTGTLQMFLPRSIQATFEPLPLEITDAVAGPEHNRVRITWNTSVPAMGTVRLGLTPDYELGELHGDGLQTEHALEISDLSPGTTYHYSIVAVDQAGRELVTSGATFKTARVFTSDDFRNTAIDTSVWTVVNPSGKASFGTTGAGTRNARLEISVPGGVSHDAWVNGINAPWLKQEVGNQDFGLEIKFDSELNAAWQTQGVIVQQDEDTFLRVDLYFEDSTIYLFAGALDNGTNQTIKVMEVPGSPPYYLRVVRSANQWRVLYSKDGRNWVAAANFAYTMTVTAVGPFISNQGSPPLEFTTGIDYIFNLDNPIYAEDGFEPDLTPPSISGIRTVPHETSIDVSWTTDEPADSRVLFGRTSSYELGSAYSDVLTSSHGLTIAGLTPLTSYNLRIVSTDESGNEAVSDNIVLSTTGNSGDGPVINVWYGDSQSFGHIGTPTPMINVLGNVSGPNPITSLSYSLNGGGFSSLSMGPNTLRLAQKGDFNVEVPYSSLYGGGNSVTIRARDNAGKETIRTVTVNNHSGPLWPAPYTVNWGGNINNVAQVSDGIWQLDGNGVRPTVVAYDRLIAIGDRRWENYEASCAVTVHYVDSNGYAPPSYGPGVGLVLHWLGHSNDGSQPWQGIYPLGAIGMFRWTTTYERFQLFGNNGRILAWSNNEGLQLGVRYVFKMRVQNASNGAQYWMKWWRDGQSEPDWQLSAIQSYNDDPGHGCLLLLAHHVDATFGPVTVTPVP